MDGLTNIIAKIHEQNEADCKLVIEAAEEKAQKILEAAKNDAASIASKIEAETDAKLAVIKTKSVSSSELEYKRAILSKKSELINSVLSKALDGIRNSEDDVYFGYIEKLIIKNALNGKGILSLSKKDLERLPENFEEKINSQLSDGKSIEISGNAASFDGGFVVEYPEMRIDCTFESLLNDKIDEVRDELSKILFA